MKECLVSIVVPIYNAEKYLNECIDSLLSQTYKNIEIILVDDGSLDNSPKICGDYVDNHNNIKYFKQKNSGAGAARSLGVKKANGEFIMFVDSDDWLKNDAVEQIVDVFAQSCADIVRFHGEYYPGGRVLEKIDTGANKYIKLSHDEIVEMLALSDKLSSMCFQAYKKKCFRGVEFACGISYCEDYLVNQRIHTKNMNMAVMGDVLYFYRKNANSTTKTSDEERLLKNINERIFACTETIKFAKANHVDGKTQSIIEGYQVERIRPDLLKLVLRSSCKEGWVSAIEKVFESESLKELLDNVPTSSKKAYMKSIGFKKRIKNTSLIEAIYGRDLNKFSRAAVVCGFLSKIKTALIR